MSAEKIKNGFQQVGEGIKEGAEACAKSLQNQMDKAKQSLEFSFNMIVDDEDCRPLRAHPSDAGLDLRVKEPCLVKKGESVIIDTGVHFEIPEGYYGKLESKSGLNIKHGIVCLGGVIDSGYTGPVIAKLYNFGDEDYSFEKGDKCVQIIFHKCYTPKLNIVDSFAETERGDNGFGSSGK